MQKEIVCKVTFYGLADVVQTISLDYINFYREMSAMFGKKTELQYKLTRPAYRSKVLVALLKQEYEVRTFTSSPTSLIVNTRLYGKITKL